MEKILRTAEKIIPKKIYRGLQPFYHYFLATLGTIAYRKPSRHIYVIGVTGTKGKSSTVEFVNSILEASGKKTAILSTIRFKIGDHSHPNTYKMTMPGRFFTQKFLHDAVQAECDYAIIEMTSEGARFYRHVGIEMNALIFTNLSPEHIESHGSFEKYKAAKLRLMRHLVRSKKPSRVVVANVDTKYGFSFLIHPVEKKYSYSLKDVSLTEETLTSSTFTYQGNTFTIPLPGRFNVANALAAIKLTTEIGVSIEDIQRGLSTITQIRGRVEKVACGQPFTVIVDYAHTDDSLRKLYETFSSATGSGTKLIAVLGSTGGGRDTWKRPVLGKIADEFCDEIIITNEDPYDENPLTIIHAVASGVTTHTPIIIEDRRLAIREAFLRAQEGDIVLITGKGTDPYIMGPYGTKIPWDDATVAREELEKMLAP
jgi:UDP-N-acetylmuramoyl-L-alanyl-D-glutamate--2,6-diaminopimelate ligase